ncbi:MAG: hypothetical protein JWM73_2454 [Solirubrobacterales bacterium]|nr:hypothetical protein [Solirubrobacterales bacterium]
MNTQARMGLAGAGVLAAVVGAVLLATSGSPGHTIAPTTAAVGPAGVPRVRTLDLATAAHRAGARFISYDYAFGINQHTSAPVRYPTNPPTNGPHFPAPAADGDYAGLVPPPTEQVVHSLEHGRVVIQYRPGLPRAQVAQLVGLFDEAPHHVLLVENRTGMRCPVAVTAWGHGMLCPTFRPEVFDAIRAFRDTYRDHGPETTA